jgi:hypothetical protein
MMEFVLTLILLSPNGYFTHEMEFTKPITEAQCISQGESMLNGWYGHKQMVTGYFCKAKGE